IERTDLTGAPGASVPAVNIVVTTPAGSDVYVAVPDLLDSTPFDLHFVAEPPGPTAETTTATAGRSTPGAIVRFGDGTYGAGGVSPDPDAPATYDAVYRVGSGVGGIVGADTIAHFSLPLAVAGLPGITAVRNPLAAVAGVDPEPVEHVRHAAP